MDYQGGIKSFLLSSLSTDHLSVSICMTNMKNLYIYTYSPVRSTESNLWVMMMIMMKMKVASRLSGLFSLIYSPVCVVSRIYMAQRVTHSSFPWQFNWQIFSRLHIQTSQMGISFHSPLRLKLTNIYFFFILITNKGSFEYIAGNIYSISLPISSNLNIPE